MLRVVAESGIDCCESIENDSDLVVHLLESALRVVGTALLPVGRQLLE